MDDVPGLLFNTPAKKISSSFCQEMGSLHFQASQWPTTDTDQNQYQHPCTLCGINCSLPLFYAWSLYRVVWTDINIPALVDIMYIVYNKNSDPGP